MRLFLDFDGVVCDSVHEAYVASHRAFYREILGVEEPATSPEREETFTTYRPFIRNGEDFVLLHRLIREGITLSSQADFDRELKRVGAETMGTYRNAIYSVRARMLEEDRSGWLRLNRIYPHVRAVIDRPAADPRCFILSTKKARYIEEILNGEGVSWPAARIISTEGREKASLIRHHSEGDGDVYFVEDQPDHFPDTWDPPGTLHCLLATWGYIQPHWLESRDHATLEPGEFREFIQRLIG